jgi:hypothetical protein
MATRLAIARALATLSRAFAGNMDEARIDVYVAALEDVTDAQIEKAVAVVVREEKGAFIPTPAVLRRAIAPAPIVIDSTRLIREIEKLSTYNPNAGMIAPSVDEVREKLGEALAYSYAAAGGPRLFSENPTGRDIASRAFEAAMVETTTRPSLPIMSAGQRLGRGGSGNVTPLIASTAASLSIERTQNAKQALPRGTACPVASNAGEPDE